MEIMPINSINAIISGRLSKQNLLLQSHRRGYQLSSPTAQSAFAQLHSRNRVSTANIIICHTQRKEEPS